jgi:GntR family phosphonate transport system transcriptional regulator
MTAEIDREAGSTLWHQIAAVLANEIESGALRPGQQLPTETKLMQRFNVSRFTIRQTIAHLEARGLVRAEQGRGTFVHKGMLDYPLSKKTRFSKNLIEQGFEPGGEMLVHEIIPAPRHVVIRLKLPLGAAVIHRVMVATADGIPIEIGDSYYPAARFPDFDKVRERFSSVSAAFATYGIRDYDRLVTEIEARLPTTDEARLLRQPKSTPVLVVRKVDIDQNGTPFNYGESVWSSERVTFTVARD